MPCALDAKNHICYAMCIRCNKNNNVMPCASDAKGIYAMSYPSDAKIKVTKMFR